MQMAFSGLHQLLRSALEQDSRPARPPGCSDAALLHVGGVRFPVTGPARYTMTAKDAVELCALVRPRTAIPIHYEGWKHFRQGREAIEREFAQAAVESS
jgi:L-ascorbate metabolism protein UlaG (beta-lactamase superfamily)